MCASVRWSKFVFFWSPDPLRIKLGWWHHCPQEFSGFKAVAFRLTRMRPMLTLFLLFCGVLWESQARINWETKGRVLIYWVDFLSICREFGILFSVCFGGWENRGFRFSFIYLRSSLGSSLTISSCTRTLLLPCTLPSFIYVAVSSAKRLAIVSALRSTSM